MTMPWRHDSCSSSSNPQTVLTAAFEGPSRSLLIQFSYLQLLDLLTTIAFLTSGVQEANPVVRLAIAAAPSPLAGLLALKAFALAGAVLCSATGRERVLSRINLLFAALVVWNLIAMLGR
jgi:hypothetical protein